MVSFTKRISIILLVAGLNGFLLTCIVGWANAASNRLDSPIPAMVMGEPSSPSQAAGDEFVYLPLVYGKPPWSSPFGVEPTSMLQEGLLSYTRTLELGVGWVRLGTQVHWRQLQPNEGDPIQWSALASFEHQLVDLKKAGIRPLVTITDSPHWATIIPSSCAAVRTDKFAAFADFMGQLVERYKTDEYNVHDWEIGNEPDVDSDLVPVDNIFGCWGDNDDPYYGGQHYGEMLKVVGAAIKQADPTARVWIGGLLLARPDSAPNPNCSIPGKCRPELFLEGILRASAASSFDIVGYHAYPYYLGVKVDPDNGNQYGPWYSWGGWTVGKPRFLRQVMQAYNADKPMMITELALMCYESATFCRPAGDGFFQMQADFVGRSFVRAIAENISGGYWYTLEGPGWRYTGLLNAGTPNPGFIAYKQLTNQLKDSRYVGTLDYGSEIEAYAFETPLKRVQVLWAKSDTTVNVILPGNKYISAYDRDGDLITPQPIGSDYQIPVGFSPVYINYNP